MRRQSKANSKEEEANHQEIDLRIPVIHEHQDRIEEKNESYAETKTRVDFPPEILGETNTSCAE